MNAETRRMKLDVFLLFCCQALMNASIVGQVAMGALVGHSLADDKSLATLPLGLQMVATMAASIPAGIIFGRLGRRVGFSLGAVASLVGSLVFAAGIWQADFWLYTAGALPAGIGAVVDALRPLGIRHIEMPATPEAIWRAIEGSHA